MNFRQKSNKFLSPKQRISPYKHAVSSSSLSFIWVSLNREKYSKIRAICRLNCPLQLDKFEGECVFALHLKTTHKLSKNLPRLFHIALNCNHQIFHRIKLTHITNFIKNSTSTSLSYQSSSKSRI